jgi:hypothetical protein
VEITAEKTIEVMKKLFGDNIVDHEVFPQQFAYQVKLATFQMRLEQNEQSNSNG